MTTYFHANHMTVLDVNDIVKVNMGSTFLLPHISPIVQCLYCIKNDITPDENEKAKG
jgi:hypothetical protein